MKLPIDFEEKVKLPPQIGGRSYPYQISANHLMQNFRYSALQVDQTPVAGFNLTEKTSLNGERTVGLTGGLSANSHPWKITDAGGGSVNIAGGKVFGARASSVGVPPTPYYIDYVSYSGETLAVASSGYIYAVISTTEEQIYSDAVLNTISFTLRPSLVTVIFSVDSPSTISDGFTGDVYWPIAEVSLSGAGDVVIDQILTHNPTLSFESVTALS